MNPQARMTDAQHYDASFPMGTGFYPVTTDEEKRLFATMIPFHTSIAPSGQHIVDFGSFTQSWNGHVRLRILSWTILPNIN
eukprot:5287271-Pyramimonas_sp.AAC.1